MAGRPPDTKAIAANAPRSGILRWSQTRTDAAWAWPIHLLERSVRPVDASETVVVAGVATSDRRIGHHLADFIACKLPLVATLSKAACDKQQQHCPPLHQFIIGSHEIFAKPIRLLCFGGSALRTPASNYRGGRS